MPVPERYKMVLEYLIQHEASATMADVVEQLKALGFSCKEIRMGFWLYINSR